MMTSYSNWLEPLGVTSSSITDEIFYANQNNYLSNSVTGSSFFSLMFSLAGIWGDLGIAGLFCYVYIWLYILNNFCAQMLDRFFIVSLMFFGVTFSWLEEPSFMLVMMSLLGISWQENNLKLTQSE